MKHSTFWLGAWSIWALALIILVGALFFSGCTTSGDIDWNTVGRVGSALLKSAEEPVYDQPAIVGYDAYGQPIFQ